MEALQAAGEGVAGLNVGIPMRYMHSPCEVAHLDDLEASASLCAALARRLGELGPGYSFVPQP
jgi:putative aminopeptidase FrvX